MTIPPTPPSPRDRYERQLRKEHPDFEPGVTGSGIDLQPAYGPEDIAGLDEERDLGYPG